MNKFICCTAVLFYLLGMDSVPQVKDTLVVASYNVENLFDTEDDPVKDDKEFLPLSENQWTQDRLDNKFFNIARVIRAMDNYNGPDIIGFTEVEHQSLLDTLSQKYLTDKYYKTAYMESPDNRGIDNGLLYNADKLRLISVHGDTVHLPDQYPTRLVLHVKLLLRGVDTVNVFVNHWPSRRGGQDESEGNRIAAAATLRMAAERVVSLNPDAKIIIAGDFNDEPNNNSILKTLGAKPVYCPQGQSSDTALFYNTAYTLFEKGEGTYKYQDDWNMLDQVIISKSLLISDKIHYLCGSFEIFKPEFILTKTGKYAGTSIPTFGGNKYLGGYSDHFPVIAKFIIE